MCIFGTSPHDLYTDCPYNWYIHGSEIPTLLLATRDFCAFDLIIIIIITRKMRISWVLAALWAVAVHADDEPEVPTIPSGVCQTIQESPFPDDDDFFNFHQVKIGEKSYRDNADDYFSPKKTYHWVSYRDCQKHFQCLPPPLLRSCLCIKHRSALLID